MLGFVHSIIFLAITLFSIVVAAPHAVKTHPTRDDTDFANAFLTNHNDFRALHSASPLEWSTSLASKAQEWANGCKFQNTAGSLSSEPYGENIAAGAGHFSITDVVRLFTKDYVDFQANHAYTHFTQVVWKSTSRLGCAVAQCDGIFDASFGKATYYVCLYDPPGNIIGKLLENVIP